MFKTKYIKQLIAIFFVFTFAVFANKGTFLFSSESVTEGHPDKVCDQISDAVLDEVLRHDPNGRVACETVASKGTIFITGEITTTHYVDFKKIAKKTLKEIGYTDPAYGISDVGCSVITVVESQSPDIAQGVDEDSEHEQGAGDQGLMFGYACDETKELMPLPIDLAHRLAKRLADVRKQKILPWLRPDGKSQVTVKYVENKPKEITTLVIAAQHDPDISLDEVKKLIMEVVVKPVCGKYLTENTKYHINGTGAFVVGGPEADAGLTGRKIIVDTYGGMARHGGGCFSGKDPSKVDRSASYMARHIAKNIVAANLAKRCEVQLAYCIGVSEPVSILVDTFDTVINGLSDEKIAEAVKKVFLLKPSQIIDYLNLKTPIYQKTAAYGHFGREDVKFSWEETNKVEQLKDALNGDLLD